MTRISATDLRPRLAEALRSAESGESVVITRHGRPAVALIAADQLEQLRPPLDAGGPADEPVGEAAAGGDASPEAAPAATPEQLLERAAAASRRRIEQDFARLPETLRPVLALIRDNLFQPGLTVERIKRTLGVGANDLTTRFRDAAGAPIRQYLDDRRLECASRLLADTELDIETIALLVGHGGREVFSRAFKRRYGVRPPVYRQFGGRLSGEAAARAAAAAATGRATALPRHLAGVATTSPGAVCARCGDELEPAAAVRVFEDLATICDGCARQQAPELIAWLDGEGG